MKNKIVYYDSPVGLVEIQADKDKIVSLDFKEEKCDQEAANSVLLTAKNNWINTSKESGKCLSCQLKLKAQNFRKASGSNY